MNSTSRYPSAVIVIPTSISESFNVVTFPIPSTNVQPVRSTSLVPLLYNSSHSPPLANRFPSAVELGRTSLNEMVLVTIGSIIKSMVAAFASPGVGNTVVCIAPLESFIRLIPERAFDHDTFSDMLPLGHFKNSSSCPLFSTPYAFVEFTATSAYSLTPRVQVLESAASNPTMWLSFRAMILPAESVRFQPDTSKGVFPLL